MTPAILTVTADHIPASLKKLPQWVLHREAVVDGKLKKKVPHTVIGTLASTINSATWDTFEHVLAAYQAGGFDGIGFVFTGQHWGADFDHVLDERGRFKHPNIRAEVAELVRMGAWAERSLSGDGVHCIGRYSGKALTGAPKHNGREAYTVARYFTINGNSLDEVPQNYNNDLTFDTTPTFLQWRAEHFKGNGMREKAPDAGQVAKGAVLDLPGNIEKAREYMKTVPQAVEKTGTYPATIAAIQYIRDKCGLSIDATFDVMQPWDQLNSPPWGEALRDKIESLEKSLLNPVGGGTPQAAFGTEAAQAALVEEDTPVPGAVSPGTRGGGSEDHLYNRKLDWTATGNANLLLKIADRNVLYVYESKRWIYYSKINPQWRTDESGGVMARYAHLVAQHWSVEAEKIETQAKAETDLESQKRLVKIAESYRAWEKVCRSTRGISDMLTEAKRAERAHISEAQLDTDPWLLGVQNGVVDLRTGTLLKEDRESLVTIHAPVAFNPNAACPTWDRFIVQVTAAPGETPLAPRLRPTLAEWLQRFFGYVSTGLICEQRFPIFNGEGGGGKNVLLDTVGYVLGPYATVINAALFMQLKWERDPDAPSSNLASLHRVRMAVASETKDGQKLNANFVKMVTGDATRRARNLYQDSFTYAPTEQVILCTNNLPGIDHLGEAEKGRINVVPFDYLHNRPGYPNPDPTKPMGDKNLFKILKQEAEGVLLWLVKGAMRYHEKGLGLCPEVELKTATYFDSQDLFQQWRNSDAVDLCEVKKEMSSATSLRTSYNDYAATRGRIELNHIEFKRLIELHRIKVDRTDAGAVYGLKLRPLGKPGGIFNED